MRSIDMKVFCECVSRYFAVEWMESAGWMCLSYETVYRLHVTWTLFVCKYILSDFWENLLSWIEIHIHSEHCTHTAHVCNIVFPWIFIYFFFWFASWMNCDIAWECILLNFNIYTFFIFSETICLWYRPLFSFDRQFNALASWILQFITVGAC